MRFRLPFPVRIALALLLTFWPAALFHSQIRFEPAKFTEEWIKLTATGLLLYLVLQKWDEIRRNRDSLDRTKQLVQSQLIKPLEELQALLTSIATSTSPDTTRLAEQVLSKCKDFSSRSREISIAPQTLSVSGKAELLPNEEDLLFLESCSRRFFTAFTSRDRDRMTALHELQHHTQKMENFLNSISSRAI